MYILLTAATNIEIAPVIEFLQRHEYRYSAHQLDILITGIGSLHTSYALTSTIYTKRPDYLIQAGIGGSFSTSCPPGTVTGIKEEINGDLGVEENGTFKDVFDMQLQQNAAPYSGKALINPYCDDWKKYGLSFVTGITINEISTRPDRIQQLQQKYQPIVESMEGAAFHYTALKENIPFMQLRSISNYTGERDKTKWKMKEAIGALNDKLIEIIKAW